MDFTRPRKYAKQYMGDVKGRELFNSIRNNHVLRASIIVQNPSITPFQIKTAFNNAALTHYNSDIVGVIANNQTISRGDIIAVMVSVVDKINRLRNIGGYNKELEKLHDVLNVLQRNYKVTPEIVMEITRNIR